VSAVVFRLSKSSIEQLGLSAFRGRAVLTVMLEDPTEWEKITAKLDGLHVSSVTTMQEELVAALNTDNDNLLEEYKKSQVAIVQLRETIALLEHELTMLKEPHRQLR
jgi:hypothetical protein